MSRADYQRFQRAVQTISEGLGEELSPTRVAVYFRVLEPYPITAVEAACFQALHRKWFKFPQPGELVELIEGTNEDHAVLAWNLAYQAALKGYGGYSWVTFEDPLIAPSVAALGGWREFYSLGFRDTEGVEVATLRKQFLETYGAYRRRGAPDADPRLSANPALASDHTEHVTPALVGSNRLLSALPRGAENEQSDRDALVDVRQAWPQLVASLTPAHTAPLRRAVVEKPLMLPPSAEEIAEHQAKVARELARFQEAR